jgi:hypothetical protein
MNKYMVGMALALLLAGGDSLAGQTAAQIEFRNGRIGVNVAIGGLPFRIGVNSRQHTWNQGTLDRQDLRNLLGKETVKRIERHGKAMGARGKTRGRWFQVDRRTTVVEVTMGGVPVAELHDYRNDGIIDEIFLTQPPRFAQYKERGNDTQYGRGRKPW